MPIECAVTLGLYKADLEEVWRVLKIKHARSQLCDVRFCVPRDLLAQPLPPAQRRQLVAGRHRTEALHSHAIRMLAACHGPAGHGCTQAMAHAIADPLGIHITTTTIPAVFGFAYTDIFHAVPVDRLHNMGSGLCVHIFKKTAAATKPATWAAVKDRLQHPSIRRLHKVGVPEEGLDSTKLTSGDKAAIMKVTQTYLPPATCAPAAAACHSECAMSAARRRSPWPRGAHWRTSTRASWPTWLR